MAEKNKLQSSLNNMKKSLPKAGFSLADGVKEIALHFLHTPYLASSLETGSREKLIINFCAFDCFTFLETVIVLTRCVRAGDLSAQSFRHELQFIRYRQGIIEGYASRLHYFSDWLYDNSKKGILKDISRQLGAKAKTKVINFMTGHCKDYPALGNKKEFQKIRNIEKNISRRRIYILSAADLDRSQGKIKTGDIIAFTSHTEGLDIAHVGFSLWQGNKLHLLHASSQAKGVTISAKPLIDYLKQNKKFDGLIAARIK